MRQWRDAGADSSEHHVEGGLVATLWTINRHGQRPPAGHIELHALNEMAAFSQVTGHLWLGRKTVTVLRHAAIDRDGDFGRRLAIGRRHLNGPAVDRADRNWRLIRSNRG